MKKKKNEVNVNKPTIEDREAMRILARALDDFQLMRIGMDNRIGRKADGKKQKVERKHRVDDMMMFQAVADAASAQEKEIRKYMDKMLERFPIYTEWLQHISGMGPSVAAHIVGNIDIVHATTPSKIIQYAGLNSDTVWGKKIKYDAKGFPYVYVTDTKIRGDKLIKGFLSPFNARLRKALCGVLASGFIKAGLRWEVIDEADYEEGSVYFKRSGTTGAAAKLPPKTPLRAVISNEHTQIYMQYKQRLLHSVREVSEIPRKGANPIKVMWKDAKPAHREAAAKRYMIKQFIYQLYNVWREIEGLEVRPPYQEEKLGHTHSGVAHDFDSSESQIGMMIEEDCDEEYDNLPTSMPYEDDDDDDMAVA